jgi:hypothetical protein
MLGGLAALILTAVNAYGQTVRVEPIAMQVDKGRHYLKMAVWNCSHADMVVQLADLPWGKHKLGLVLYPAGKLASDPLKENVPIEGAQDRQVEIREGGRAVGTIDLDAAFPSIGRYENQHNVLMFWAYDASLVEGGASRFVGGMFHLDGEGIVHTVPGCPA